MYRDDREALQARADALQNQLDEAERTNVEQKRDLEMVTGKLTNALVELMELRKRVAKLEPPADRSAHAKRRAMIGFVAAAVVVLVGALVALMSLRADAPEIAQPEPPRVLRPQPPVRVGPPPPVPEVASALCDAAAIEAALRGSMLRLHECHQQHESALAGSLTATWELDLGGVVRNLKIDGDDSANVATCITNEIESARFTARGCQAARQFDFAATCLDEVECLLADQPPPCCVQYRNTARGPR